MQSTEQDQSRPVSAKLPYLAATLALLGGIVHLRVMQEHFQEWWGYGAFFLVLAIFEGLYAVALINRPGRRLLIVGMAVRISVLTLYLVTRTVGVSLIGPHAGHIEQVAIVDLIAVTANAALIVALAALWLSGRGAEFDSKSGPAESRANS